MNTDDTRLTEIQIDRLVGPTHHFGGLGVGNLASAKHSGQASHPKAAALQGLAKMQLVASLGVPQWVLPPQPRPDLELLKDLGFNGTSQQICESALQQSPTVFSASISSSAMWTANAATVTPAIDSAADQSVVTVANLNASLHRSIEPSTTKSELQSLLPSSIWTTPCLPGGAAMRDEGAANHMRLSFGVGPGINIFVYGDQDPRPAEHWPRQTLASCKAIARRHQLIEENTFFLKQSPTAIDAGAFHNDVVAISHKHVWIHHQHAYDDTETIAKIESRAATLGGTTLQRIEVPDSELPLDQAVQTYLFNSQIVTAPELDDAFVILCPRQVERNASAASLVNQWCEAKIFGRVHFVDLDQSMAGGGGPACLRLRVPATAEQLKRFRIAAKLTDAKSIELRQIIETSYPDEITLADLKSSDLIDQCTTAITELRDALQFW